MPPGGFEPAKPTSGKAIAALICGLAGPIGAFLCAPLGVAVLVGVILGILAIIETGKNGSRSGRGLAITGTVLSTLGIVATIAAFVGFLALMRAGEEDDKERNTELISSDQQLILDRLKEYCVANGNSLGPGGPVLAHETPKKDQRYPTSGNEPAPRPVGGTVEKALELEDLVGKGELEWSRRRGGSGWELVITGQKTATLRARHWNGEILREIEVRDAARGMWVQTVP